MAQGAQRMDQLFAQALAAGQLSRDPSLNLPPPPVLELPVRDRRSRSRRRRRNAYQVQISGKDVIIYNFAMAHLRTLPGVESATPQQINPGGTSYMLVELPRRHLAACGGADARVAGSSSMPGTVVQMRSPSDKPPALPPPPPPCSRQPPAHRNPQRQPQPAAARAAMKQGPDQIALPLDWPQSEGDARFIVSDANREAFDHFRKWSLWPVKATILTGPRRSGRTLLARSFVERVGGRLFDEAEQRDEEELFHAWNQAQDTGRPLVMIADEVPPAWSPRCPTEDPAGGHAGGADRPSGRRAVRRADPAPFRRSRAAHPGRCAALHDRAAAPRLLDGRAGGRGRRPFRDLRAGAPVAADDPPRADRSADDRRGGLAAADRRDLAVADRARP